jgi:serine/threonine protein kinase
MSGDVIVLSPSMGIKREQPQCGLRARRALAPIKIQGMIASGKSYEDALRNDGYVPGAVFARSFRPEGFVLRHCSSKTASSESPSISLVEASAQESSERKFAAASSTPEWERLAVKCTEERRGAGEMARLLQKEYDILRTLSHPNIVMAKHLVEADFGCAMVMELCAGDRLDRVTRESNNLSGESKRSITEQILCAVEYLHSEQVCHRNLHPRNIVVNKKLLLSRSSISNVHARNSNLARHGVLVAKTTKSCPSKSAISVGAYFHP